MGGRFVGDVVRGREGATERRSEGARERGSEGARAMERVERKWEGGKNLIDGWMGGWVDGWMGG